MCATAWFRQRPRASSTKLPSQRMANSIRPRPYNCEADRMALRCDLIIRDATVFDGTGSARLKADVGVTGDRITAVGDLGAASADREVVATGKAIAPGFIDAHTHDDRAVLCGPECMLCKMSQGV